MPTWTMPEAWVKERDRFRSATPEHEMTVLRDDGLYRHLRFAKPGTSMYLYDLVTWPGHLVVCGDIESFHFARTADMFEFFEGSHGEINPHYWGEKLQGIGGRREQAMEFSREAFERHVREWVDDQCEYMADCGSEPTDVSSLRAVVQEQLLDMDAIDGRPYTEDDAHLMLRDFEHEGRSIGDSWEWDLRDWRPQYLFSCWAIVDGIRRYREAK